MSIAFPRHPDPLRYWSKLAPSRVAVIDRSLAARRTYAELDRDSDRWAALLRTCGVAKGDRVAVLSGTRHEVIALLYACGRVGAALVPLNWRLTAAELAPIVASAGVKLVVGEGRYRALLESADGAGSTRWIDLDAEAPLLLGRAGSGTVACAADVIVAPDDPWLVLYTSGSTGTPKGAVLPHRQLFFNAVATATAWELGPADIAPVGTPLFHTGGWNVFATPLLACGGAVILFDRFEPGDYLAALAEEQATVAFGVPTQLVMLLESVGWNTEIPSLRRIFSGGAPCPPGVLAHVRERYLLREGYGLTECGPNCFAISDAEAVENPGAVGRPMPFLEARLVTTDGRDANPGEAGELWLRGPQVFSGYLDAPTLTAEVLDAEGWLRTGDIATRDAAGLHRICGRTKEMFISGGENVYPAEVEAALSDCPGVAEVAVVAVPDSRWGEVGHAVLVPRCDTVVDAAEVLAFARMRLAGYKVPRDVLIVDALPRLGSGKPDRRAIAATAAARAGAGGGTLPAALPETAPE